MRGVVLEIRDLVKSFLLKDHSRLVAVNGVSLTIHEGETVGVVGESGSGKTTLGRCLLRLLEPDSGSILFSDRDLMTMKNEPLRRHRAKMQIVYQDPIAAFNPRMRVGEIIAEPLRLHEKLPVGKIDRRVRELMGTVGLPKGLEARRPHELNKGQRQLVAIARAIATRPRLIVLDEPTGLLDLSVRVKIIQILQQLQKDLGLAYMFISHDLSTVRAISQRLAIMYLGKIVETGSTEDVFQGPVHPYSVALLSSVLLPRPEQVHLRLRLSGEIPSPINLPPGCSLATRCPLAEERCHIIPPPRAFPAGADLGDNWWATCHPLSESTLDAWYRRLAEAKSSEPLLD